MGIGTPVLEELLDESLAELLVIDADWLLLVSEDVVDLDPSLVDVSELDVVVSMSGGIVETDCELEPELVVLMSEVVVDAESVPELEPDDIDDDEPVLELEPDISIMVDELVLTEFVRVLTEVVLPVAELELEELDESMGGPAEYTMAPAG